jgi:RNA polymerase sigma factor (TIGR02999 family)
MPLIYNEVRQLAARALRRERPAHTLQATALVHEAYLRLVDQSQVQWQNRAHFFGIAAQMMRRVLVDHARRQHAAKRGGQRQQISLDDAVEVSAVRPAEVLMLDDALTNLARVDARQSRIVELRVFGGLTIDEVAEVLCLSPATVKREWSLAKAWYTELYTRERAMTPPGTQGGQAGWQPQAGQLTKLHRLAGDLDTIVLMALRKAQGAVAALRLRGAVVRGSPPPCGGLTRDGAAPDTRLS